VALVRKRTIPTERPPLVGEVSANFSGLEGVAWSAQRIPTTVNFGFLDRIKKNTETLIDVSREVGLEVNTEKAKYMLLSRHQNAGQIQDIKIANRYFENVAQFRYLGTTITHQNLIEEEIKRRLNSGNA
jgi:hypothetical protein